MENTRVQIQNEQIDLLLYDVRNADFSETNKSAVLKKRDLVQRLFLDESDSRGFAIVSHLFGSSDKDLKFFAKSIVEDNMDCVLARLKKQDDTLPIALRVLGQFIDVLQGDKKDKALGEMRKALPDLLDSADEEILPVSIIEHAIEYGNKNESDRAKKIIENELDQLGNPDRNQDGDFISHKRLDKSRIKLLMNSDKSGVFSETYRLINRHLGKFGLDGYKLMGIWRKAVKHEEFEVVTVLNIATINEIEKRKTGISKIILENNRVSNFARFPVEILLRQKDAMTGEILQIITTTEDRNGAFYDHHNYGVYKDLTKLMSQKFSIQIFEVNPDFPELPSSAVASKIKMIYAHGEPTKMQLGNNSDGKPVMVTARDIYKNPRILGFSNIMNGSRLVLCSCSTGHVFEGGQSNLKGFAQELSELFDIKVAAPIKTAGLEKITIELSGGNNVVLLPAYKEEGFDNIPVETRYFQGGKRISEHNYKN